MHPVERKHHHVISLCELCHSGVYRPRLPWLPPLSPRTPPVLPAGVNLRHRHPIPLAAIRPLRLLILLTGSVLFALPAAAAPPPPSRGDAPPATSPLVRFADDPRLDQAISLTAWSEPLEDVLSRLSQETGVPLTFEGRDVGDQRVDIVLKEQPLRRVQALLAETLDLYWRRERKAPRYRYVLLQDLRSRRQEQELLARGRAQFEAGMRRNIDALKLSPTEIEELRTQNPYLAQRLSEPNTRKAFEFLGSLEPRHWERLLQAGRVEIPYASLSSRAQEAAREYGEAQRKLMAEHDAQRGTPGRRHLGDITQPGGKMVIHLFDGAQPGPESECCVDFVPADGSLTANFFGPAYSPEERALLHDRFRPPGFEKATRDSSDDPGPRITVTWKPKEWLPWEDVLQAVVASANLQVVCDTYLYYWHESHSQLPRESRVRDQPVAEALDQVAPPFLYVWRREGDVYLFRRWNWFQEKLHNIPERDLRRWRGHLEANGRLWLEDLAEMALLTESQLRLLYHTAIPYGSARTNREVLQLYAALNPFQRARLETTGLRLRELSPPQAALMHAWRPAAAHPEDRLRHRRERDAVVFRLESETTAPQEARIPLERAPAGTRD